MKDYRALFHDSQQRLISDRDEYQDFLAAFYQRFVAASPKAAAHFEGTDMVRQRRMLARSLTEIIEFSETGVATDYLRQVARRHSHDERNVEPELYETWLDCLVATMRDFQPEADDETELAWRVVLAPGVAYMQYRYDRY